MVANLGYGLRLRSRIADDERAILFDAGTEPAAFVRNCEKNLHLDLGIVEEIAISHGHWDHMGALIAAIDKIIMSRGIRCGACQSGGCSSNAAFDSPTARPFPSQPCPVRPRCASTGATVVNNGEARLLLDGQLYYSGEIPRVTAFEKGRVDHLCRPDDATGDWRPDPPLFLLDERMLIAHVRDLGLVIFSACSHAGIVNVCTEAHRLFPPDIPIHAVMGGLHLGGGHGAGHPPKQSRG